MPSTRPKSCWWRIRSRQAAVGHGARNHPKPAVEAGCQFLACRPGELPSREVDVILLHFRRNRLMRAGSLMRLPGERRGNRQRQRQQHDDEREAGKPGEQSSHGRVRRAMAEDTPAAGMFGGPELTSS